MDALEPILLNVRVGVDRVRTEDEAAKLIDDINELEPSSIKASPVPATSPRGTTKGDPVTIGAIILAAVGAGGALAKGFSADGFFSKLAGIIGERISKGVIISITKSDGTEIKLAGTADDIAKLLKLHSRRR
jgi:hypothetical protein